MGAEPPSRRCGQLFQARHRELDGLARWTKREADVIAESRSAAMPTLARVHVEELAGNRDDLLRETSAEKAHPVVEGGRECRDAPPGVEGAIGKPIEAHAEPL